MFLGQGVRFAECLESIHVASGFLLHYLHHAKLALAYDLFLLKVIQVHPQVPQLVNSASVCGSGRKLSFAFAITRFIRLKIK